LQAGRFADVTSILWAAYGGACTRAFNEYQRSPIQHPKAAPFLSDPEAQKVFPIIDRSFAAQASGS
jgi:hypothetical protein